MAVPINLQADSSLTCPNCLKSGLMPFYEAEGVPVHSTQRLSDRSQAISYPSGALRLAFCPHCAFITNTRYAEDVQNYCDNCEESQAFSPTFNAFAKRLAQRWVDRYQLRGKKVLEIGCGKADFLMLLVDSGVREGIGIDPSCQPDRIPQPFRDRLSLIQEKYQQKHEALAADVVLCRHTLEHILPTHQFVQGVRDTLHARHATLVLFELPDIRRILIENAFWDMYYEHCSYFSAGSLARLFRSCSFDLTELERDYGDQYLLIAGKPSGRPTQPALPLENDLAEMTTLVQHFAATVGNTIAFWRDEILSRHNKGQKVCVWGSLSKGVSFLTTTKVGDAVGYVFDVNPFRQGKFMPTTGQAIVAPAFLAQYKPDCVVLMNPIYRNEVQADLDKHGVTADLLAVGEDDRSSRK